MLRAWLSEGRWRGSPSEEEEQEEWTILVPSTCALLRPRQHLLAEWVMAAHDATLGDGVFMEACEPASARALNELLVCNHSTLSNSGTIRRVSTMSEEEFLFKHMLGNRPLLLTRDEEVSSWPVQKWGTDVDAIETAVGRDRRVPVTFDDDPVQKRVSFGEFADAWREGRRVYLKDWAFKLEGFEHVAPEIPRLFARFRNWLSRKHERDYCFLYLGTKGTRTRLHADVLNSFSWSANVKGTKVWHLLPATHTHLIHDISGKHVAADFFPESRWTKCRCGSIRYFPLIQQAQPIQLTQTTGQVIFVPSGWYHTVENLENTLSINANWMNACNVLWAIPRLEDRDSQDPVFGGDNLSKFAFAQRLVESIRDDDAALRRRDDGEDDDEKRAFSLFQIQRAAALLRLLGRHQEEVTEAIELADSVLRLENVSTSLDLEEKLCDEFRRSRIRHRLPIDEKNPLASKVRGNM